MAWNPVGLLIPETDWKFSEPVEGDYFQLEHITSDLPYEYFKGEICQGEIDEDGTIRIFDAQPLDTQKELDVVKLKKPPIFTERRIGIRRNRENTNTPPSSKPLVWEINVSVSDVVDGGTETPPAEPTTKDLTIEFPGDAKGFLYWLGTAKGTSPWENPNSAGYIVVSQSSAYSGGNNQPGLLCNRQADNAAATADTANSYFDFDFKNNEIKPNHYCLRGREYYANHPRNWKLLWSQDGETWDELDNQTNNPTITQGVWFDGAITATQFYKRCRLQMTGPDSNGSQILSLAEVEFYGTVKL